MDFSLNELQELGRAWLLVSIAFAVVFVGFSLDARFFFAILMAGFTAGVGFLLHEIAHKFVAQRFGCRAVFHAFDKMLWIGVLASFFGFVFVAPGAVFIQGRVTSKKNGLISLAGPLTNVLIGLCFVFLFWIINVDFVKVFAVMGLRINFWLAFFNMLPIMGLDGTKVLNWNKKIYAVILSACVLLAFGSNLLI